MRQLFDFEKPIESIEKKIDELSTFADSKADEKKLKELTEKRDKELVGIYSKLDAWQVTQVARHPDRPYVLDYINLICEDFIELHGDRAFRDDEAIVGGFGKIDGQKVMIIGQQKGRNTKEKLRRNFGMPHPEGYRKALRLMRMAERFNKPIVTLIDTPGAYPGVGAEERGQAEAIAVNLMEMSEMGVPMISVVISEGGSGGALALGVTDRILMLEFSTYSVISPEGCAAILWKDGAKASVAANALKINSSELLKLGVIDKIIKEPIGGAHRNHEQTAENLKTEILATLKELKERPLDTLLEERYEKYRTMGNFEIKE